MRKLIYWESLLLTLRIFYCSFQVSRSQFNVYKEHTFKRFINGWYVSQLYKPLPNYYNKIMPIYTHKKINVRLWILCKFDLYLWKLRLCEDTPPHSSNNNSEKLPKEILMESPNFGRHSQQEGEKKKKRINQTITSNRQDQILQSWTPSTAQSQLSFTAASQELLR